MNHRSKPWILGLSTRHNGAAALLHGDELVVAIQEERLLRMKRAEHPVAVPSLSMRYCLTAAGISASDLNAVAVCGFSKDDPAEDVSTNVLLQTSFHRTEVFRAPHHLAHAYAAFYMSGFKESSVMVIDGHGGNLTTLTSEEFATISPKQRQASCSVSPAEVYETISLYAASERSFVPVEKHVSIVNDPRPKVGMPFFHTLGKLYACVGLQIFGDYQTWGLDASGKVMGLAPYGKPTIPVKDFYSIEDCGFVFHDGVPLAYNHYEHWPLRADEYMNLAASAQVAIEDAVLFIAAQLKQLSPNRNLCYAGGVALNGVANECLVREGGFSNVFLMPAAEDSGTAIGAAYFALAQLGESRTSRRAVADSVGRKYQTDHVSRAIAGTPGVFQEEADALPEAAKLLAEGKILAWFQGGSELGPRSLGQRSIVCDPRRAEMKDMLNSRVKFREAFRPYAPVILLDSASEWLDIDPNEESPFMLRVMKFREPKRKLVPAVVHVDGTGRIQTVSREGNSQLYQLLELFFEKTGVPVLLNTSLNVAGEPIAESPEDALWYLLSTGLDGCVIEDRLVLKKTNFHSVLDLFPKLSNSEILACRRGGTATLYPGRGFWCFSGPCELMDSICTRAARYTQEYLCVVVSGPLGRVVHAMDAKWKGTLDLMNGHHNGWQVLGAIQSVDALSSERSFYQMLGRLRLGSGLELSAREKFSMQAYTPHIAEGRATLLEVTKNANAS